MINNRSILKLFILLFTFVSVQSFAQSKISQTIADNQAELSAIDATTIFSPIDSDNLAERSADLPSKFDLFKIDLIAANAIAKKQDKVLKLNVPFQGNQLTLELVKTNIFSPDFKVRAASNPDKELKLNLGVQYWGKVVGYDQSLVALSITKDNLGGVISFRGGNYNLGKMDNSEDYILYRASDFNAPSSIPCYADDLAQEKGNKHVSTTQKMDESNCVGIYCETALDMFTEEGSVAAVTDKVILIFAEVFVLYTEEAINMNLNELLVWDVDDPYDASNPGGYLNDLVNNVPSSAGDLVHLLSYDVAGGVAYLDQLCGTLNYGFSGIFTSYNNVPTYSWTIEVITHEIGHNLGSPHTHACAWNGDNTAIDGCGPEAGYDEGCDEALPDAGTIMSYCHLVSDVGIDFNLGFGPQPGDLIRDEVYNAGCLGVCSDCETIGEPCDDGDACTIGDEYNVLCECVGVYTDADNDGFCVGEDEDDNDPCVPIECPECTDFVLTIELDTYPGETTWEVYDVTGLVVASGGAYPGQAFETVTESFCLIDGCYTFIIYDSFGDGICCGYGEGSYVLTDPNGDVVLSGGEFGDEESTEFCVETTEVPCVVVDENDVEAGWGIWNDGGADAAKTNNIAFANSGTHSFLIKDNTSTSVITTDDMDLSGFVEITVDFNYYAIGFNNSNQDFWLQVSTDGGATFVTVGSWVYTEDFTNNVREFVSTVAYGPFTSNTQLRFRCDATANNDKVYIDDIVIAGCEVSTAACDDGIQNGSETDIDCGGADCVECEGCYDQDINDFELGLDNWVDGGADARRNSLDAAFANTGTYCVRLQDDTNESNITSNSMDLSAYNYLYVDFTFITASMEAGEGFTIQLSLDGGATFTTFDTWILDDDFQNGVREFEFPDMVGPFSAETQIRFQCEGSNNSDRVYIDDVKIVACYDIPVLNEASVAESRTAQVDQLGFELQPNPVSASESLKINIESNDASVNLQVIDLYGNMIVNNTVVENNYQAYTLNTNTLTEGTYIIRVGNQENYEVKKFVVIK